jgi:hypothetical protein
VCCVLRVVIMVLAGCGSCSRWAMRLLGDNCCTCAVSHTLPVHYALRARDEWRKVLILCHVRCCTVLTILP